MYKAVLILLALTTPALADDALPSSLSLDDALRLALSHQPHLVRARAETEIARARADEARSPLLPQISGTAAYQRATANFVARPGALPGALSPRSQSTSFDTFNFFNAGVTASQLVYDFGQASHRLASANASAAGQVDNERTRRLEIALDVRAAFFQARAASALVVVAEQALANQDRHLHQVQGFVEVGSRPEIDLAQVRTDRANARVQLINAQNTFETSKAQLNLAMGVEGSTAYSIAESPLVPVAGEEQPRDDLLREALRARPEFASLAHQRSASELALRAIEGAYGPSLNVATGLTEGGASFESMAWNWNANVFLNWPIFQGGLTRAQTRGARATLSSIDADLHSQRLQVHLEVDQARLAVRAAKESLGASGDAVQNARERLRLAEGRYQSGMGNVIELGDAQLALTTADAQQIQAEYNLASARARLVKALGRE